MSQARISKKKQRQRSHRLTSNVFAMFNQAQIQEFKEAFNMIDQNRDGEIDKEDLIEILTSLGKNPSDEELDQMMKEAPGPINFTMFLTIFGQKLSGTDPEDVIQNAFGYFDQAATGFISEDVLRNYMTIMGDRWTEEQLDELFHNAPVVNGQLDVAKFVHILKHGNSDTADEGPLLLPPTVTPNTITTSPPTNPAPISQATEKQSAKNATEQPTEKSKPVTATKSSTKSAKLPTKFSQKELASTTVAPKDSKKLLSPISPLAAAKKKFK